MGWTARNIPDQSGRIAVVTGANSGIGYITARELARRGARVVLACRSHERGAAALQRLRTELPEAAAEFRRLDLSDLSSVRAFAASFPGEQLGLLVNNAGVMAVPYARTADGFEMQFGVNHLGHFALTGLLLEHLAAAPDARVVSVSSMAHLLAGIDMGDLQSERRYHRWLAYGASKTANLLFIDELARRTAHRGTGPLAVAAHPGYSATELQTRGARLAGRRATERIMHLGNLLIGSSPEVGAAPLLFAATAPQVRNGSFHGPHLLGLRGDPAPSWRAPWARNSVTADRLWAASEQLTGVTFS